MLIEFTVGNYLSFKEKKTLSMEAAAIKDNPENVIDAGKYKLLRSAVIYGANSSGKSNFIKALDKMREIITGSSQYNSTSNINVVPFLLSTETENKPSYFEILILIDNVRYRYGFEADNKMIHSEWLFERKVNTERNLFYRDKDIYEMAADFGEGNGIVIKTRGNALFLSVVDQFNGAISKKIMSWFNIINIFSGITHEKEKQITSLVLGDERIKNWIKEFISPF